MAVRALIIAVEHYPRVVGGGIAKTLPGTLQAGLRFKDWLLKKWEQEKRNGANFAIDLLLRAGAARRFRREQ